MPATHSWTLKNVPWAKGTVFLALSLRAHYRFTEATPEAASGGGGVCVGETNACISRIQSDNLLVFGGPDKLSRSLPCT